MGNKICLDTDILIDFLRGKAYASEWILDTEKTNTLATTTINLFELYYGASISETPKEKTIAVDELKKNLVILELAAEDSKLAGEKMAELKTQGNMIDFRDVLVSAIAMNEGFSIKTNNLKHFQRINGLEVEN
ncbi:MAG: type II toxin-antitoxin system VapC family toxin [Nanoarchaeota archaeon]|jgi:tRNA(fMet)-specific endonuclease VapC|nr:type II toxin-antitoxin system VapC family toxin [Nanoarchaeota archaeon]